jgi:DNA-binding SARP family transcriptional activator/predicted ATPase
MSRLTVSLLGSFQVTLDGRPVEGLTSEKIQALLAYLALEADRPHSREELAALLWPEQDEQKALQNLRQALSRLQRAAALPDVLLVTRQAVQFNPASDVWLDAAVFSDAGSFCRQHTHRLRHRCRRCGRKLEEGMAVYRGDFLQGVQADSLPFEEWALLKREWFRREAISLLDDLAQRYEWQGRYDQAYQAAWRLVEIDPLYEKGHRQVMRALALAGRPEEAMRQYRTLRDLLHEELDVAPAAETVALFEAIRAGNLDREAGAPAVSVSLPAQHTSFIGRDEELAQIAERLDHSDCHLLTLVGPGGVGKTRLALQTAQEKGDEFNAGVVFVSLAAAESAATLLTTVANSLGVTFPPEVRNSDARQVHLLHSLRRRELLLILDNYEQLLPETRLILSILDQAPAVRLLVTSRQPLHLRAEWVLDISGMTYPNRQPMEITEAAVALTYEAVQFFDQSARRVQASFSLSAETVPPVVQLCRLLDGIPLALELAAAWVREYRPPQLAGEIGRNLDFLATTMADVPPRHRSIRAVFDHSWHLLGERERHTLRQLACFRGGFSGEAAALVAGANEDSLAALLARSLLRQEPVGRYDLHELVRQFAAERLAAEPAEEAAVQRRHTEYFTGLVQAQGEGLSSYQAAGAVAVFRRELDNVRAAWQWAVAQVQTEAIGQTFPALARFYELINLADEGEAALAQAVSAVHPHLDPAAAPWLIELLATQAHFYNLQAKYDRALAAAQAAVALAEAHGLAGRTAAATLYWAEAMLYQGYYDDAPPYLERALVLARARLELDTIAAALQAQASYFEHRGEEEKAQANVAEALDIYQELGDPWGEAKALRHLGAMAAHAGHYDLSRDYYQRALVGYRQLGDRRGESGIYNNLGAGFLDQGRYAEARENLAEALRLRREVAADKEASTSLINLGNTAGMEGDFAAAQVYLEEALAIMRDIGNQRGAGTILCFLGYAVLCQHQVASAEAIFQEALAVTESVGSVAYAALARFRLGQIAWLRGETAGALLAFEAALAIARQSLFSYLMLDVLADLGLLYQELGQTEKATATSEEAVREARPFNRPPAQAQALTRRGDVLVRQGKREEAATAYQEALALRRSFNQTHLAAEPLAGLAEVTLAQGQSRQALAYAEEVLAVDRATKLQGVLRPAVVYRICSRVLHAVGNRAEKPK